jgi:hypothetical protein
MQRHVTEVGHGVRMIEDELEVGIEGSVSDLLDTRLTVGGHHRQRAILPAARGRQALQRHDRFVELADVIVVVSTRSSVIRFPAALITATVQLFKWLSIPIYLSTGVLLDLRLVRLMVHPA